MRTKITDRRETKRSDVVVTNDGVVGPDDININYVDTRQVFIYFEAGEVADWSESRGWRSGQGRSRDLDKSWRPAWVIAGWYRHSDSEVWRTETVKIKSHNVKKNGEVGLLERDSHMYSRSEYEDRLPAAAAAFIVDNHPDKVAFTFSTTRVQAKPGKEEVDA